tara:strand:- start:1248 stop:1469 length:222 start_codon:yes stop_codon:yes gene_type:complete
MDNELIKSLESGLWSLLSDDNENSEAFFSWSACEACGDSLGGDRYTVACIESGNPSGNILQADICTECVLNRI